jgi:hypothetical protein
MLMPASRDLDPPVIPAEAMRAAGEQRFGRDLARFDPLDEVPDNLAPTGLGFRDDGCGAATP